MACSSSNRNSASALHELGLADAGGTQEQERADRPVGVLETGARAAHGVGDRTMASSWPTTRLAIRDSMRSSLSRVNSRVGLASCTTRC